MHTYYIYSKEPTRIVLKETQQFRLAGRRRKVVIKKEEIMYIPLLETLQHLLNKTAVYEEVNCISGDCIKCVCPICMYCMDIIIVMLKVMDGHQQTCAGILSDYCDGKRFHENQLFSTNPVALQLMLYYDELELCNPLGSRRKKHKIGMLYTKEVCVIPEQCFFLDILL